MQSADFFFLLDIPMVVLMLILANLSRRLGMALKIPPYFSLLYATAGLVIIGFALDIIGGRLGIGIPARLPMMFRLVAGIAACGVGIRYWGWLFREFFTNKRSSP